MRGHTITAGEKIAMIRTTFAGVTLGVVLVMGLGVTSTPAQRGLGVVPREGAERRVALVIGNAAYDAAIGRLVNPAHDAEDMAAALGELGFQVTLKRDLDREGMERAMEDFRASAQGSGGYIGRPGSDIWPAYMGATPGKGREPCG